MVLAGAWIKDLLTLPTKLMTKRLKELKSVLQNSFHHAPCLKFTTKGPLTLKDLQQLTPSMSKLLGTTTSLDKIKMVFHSMNANIRFSVYEISWAWVHILEPLSHLGDGVNIVVIVFNISLPLVCVPAALGDDCQPLPIRPVIVGYDHEWISVSPLAIPSWVSYTSHKH